MSIEAVSQFLQKVGEDSKLQEELAKAMESENDRQAVVEMAAKYGYQFTGDELGQTIDTMQKAAANSGELNEEELEAVAGGACTPAVTPFVPAIGAGIGAVGAIGGAAINRYAKW